MRHSLFAGAAAALTLTLISLPLGASQLVYQPVNPSFGGSPLNGNWLQSEASAQNEFTRREQHRSQLNSALSQSTSSTQNQLTPGQLFARQLQSQLYSSLANKITQSIFGENAQQNGTFAFEGTVISFNRIGSNVQVTIDDGQSVTSVTVPAGP
ncbi:curli assembly protein CsgF [Alsobacter sp. KACC 23698]|uniref:Curli production assembly/transport component CsgF n=1 Tax=Alsobacter sp. KACC 23698 TaxID=3149229 RepID=A0AAU7JJ51_9HYPH